MVRCTDTSDFPIIDVQEYMNNGELAKEQCRKAVESLHQHGILIVKDVVSVLWSIFDIRFLILVFITPRVESHRGGQRYIYQYDGTIL